MSDETNLLPCPFCGGEAHVVSDYSSEHDETRWSLWHECCEHDGESAGYGHALFPWFETPWYATDAEAIAAWNTRAELGSGTCKLIDTTSPGNDDYWNSAKCSECGAEFTCAIFGRSSDTPDADYCPSCGKVVEQ